MGLKQTVIVTLLGSKEDLSLSTIYLDALNCHYVLTAIFPGEPGLAGFIGAKDGGCGGGNWSCKLAL